MPVLFLSLQMTMADPNRHKENEREPRNKPTLTYWEFLKGHRNYRFFLTSFLITHFGEWLTYIASIDFIEASRESKNQTTSRTAISILVMVRLLPNVFLSPLGGSLADALDRKQIMMALDLAGALCALLFVLAYDYQSVSLLYVASLLQQCIAGLYEPSHSAMVPQLVSSDAALQKATTIEGLTWSAMQAFGAAASGWIVDALGIRMCFLVDGLTYLASVIFLYFVQGSYQVEHVQVETLSSQEESVSATSVGKAQSPLRKLQTMVAEGVEYLSSSYFGALIFLKGTSALGYGACDILNVAFSEQANTSPSNTMTDNARLGILFSLAGIGCLVGPLAMDSYILVERPKTLQASCVFAFGISCLGYVAWTIFPSFEAVAVFSILRAAGSSIIWIHSNLLLQKLAAPHMLGRVLAADYAIALVNEALSAFLCGVVMDQAHWTPYQVSAGLAGLTAIFTALWWSYYLSGKGAGKYEPPSTPDRDEEFKVDSESSSLLRIE